MPLSSAVGQRQDCAGTFEAVGRGFESLRARQPNKINGFRDSASPEGPEKADAHPRTSFEAALEAFILTRRVSNCSHRTIGGYAGALRRFARTLGIHDL